MHHNRLQDYAMIVPKVAMTRCATSLTLAAKMLPKVLGSYWKPLPMLGTVEKTKQQTLHKCSRDISKHVGSTPLGKTNHETTVKF